MNQVIFIFFLFCYYGCLCISGGSALIPVYIEDLVNTRHWMTLQEFGNLIAVSQMTPGPIGINAATFFGFKQAGVAGALAATVGLLFVPYFLMMFAVKSLDKWERSRVVQGIMSGIKPATVGMILAALLIFMEMSVLSEAIPWHWLAHMGEALPETFYLRPVALLIFAASTVLLYKTKISIMAVIFGSAALGAFLC